ncbi:hypothetical protein PC116_g23937 [Phytophthora cactorum]|nr:hypothetical protein PC119_g21400 [Phytophthora cactorum]KAG3133806.1 hypothetical protein C6341_g22390 [Phytophthora cactorum]KAG4227683.1 hypothetical protein PC116_g23937 [Phytophthora cactorum]
MTVSGVPSDEITGTFMGSRGVMCGIKSGLESTGFGDSARWKPGGYCSGPPYPRHGDVVETPPWCTDAKQTIPNLQHY